jgi:type I restriction enzyme S subunit
VPAIHDDSFAFRHPLNPKFVPYYLQTAAFHAEKSELVARTKVKRLAAENPGRLRILAPPPEEQERIVGILDALVNHLSSGQPGEIKACRQQYEHHRDPSLSFQEAA